MIADVAIVGGGPAGAALAALLARRGRRVVVIERAPTVRWRACGVFSSPASMDALRRIGLDEASLRRAARPVPAMRVETPAGTSFRLAYGDDGSLRAPPVGFDRSTLDPALLALAREGGAEVRLGAAVTAFDGGRLALREGSAETHADARVVVGADGIRSTIARSLGVVRRARLGPRTGLTFHVDDPAPATPRDARMILFRDGYVGLAPVPGRVNVGIVIGRSWSDELRATGAEGVVQRVLSAIPAAPDDPVDWRAAQRCDPIEGAAPLGHRVARRHGPNWLLVGDAAGFLDPFTGEGLHRALVSAELAASAIDRHLDGDPAGLAGYEAAMRARFRAKDALSLLVQVFLGRPAAFDYAAQRLAVRSAVRETMGLVMGDLVPASRGLDPRFLAALLAP
ncbi:MAG TPA: NAD(P)/FAD-dependent oxidoreductase [Candidatus Limnocylindrales bacterium]|nr:NAD(P)/FAD-dependent oxidoreductase [Candidatus Limnocylindrales bacterium]